MRLKHRLGDTNTSLCFVSGFCGAPGLVVEPWVKIQLGRGLFVNLIFSQPTGGRQQKLHGGDLRLLKQRRLLAATEGSRWAEGKQKILHPSPNIAKECP